MTCVFSTATAAAQFVAELVRQGVTFRMVQLVTEGRGIEGRFEVTLTGGF